MKWGTKMTAAALALTLAAASVPAKAYSLPYEDVSDQHWAYADILYASQWGLLQGREDGNFHPEDALTRAEFVSILARVGNVQLSRYPGSDFQDVPENAWYAQAVNWANRMGVASGVGNGRFDPGGAVTREQMATMSYQFLKSMGITYGNDNTALPYSDADSISDWALDAVKAMYTSKLITGREDGSFDPFAPTSRAEAAAMIRRLYINLDDQSAPAPDGGEDNTGGQNPGEDTGENTSGN